MVHPAAYNSTSFVNIMLMGLCGMLVFGSCSKKKMSDAYYHSVFEEADEMFRNGKKKEAVTFVDSAFNDAFPSNPYFQYKRYNLKSRYYYVTGAIDSNRVYIDSAIYVFESNHITHKYPAQYAEELNSRGNHYYDENELGKAFEYFYRSKSAALGTKDLCAYSNHSYHLGMVTYRQEKYNEAAHYFKLAFAELKYCTDDTVKLFKGQEFLNNTALAFTHTGNYDSARLYYNNALEYIAREAPRFQFQSIRAFSEAATGVIYGNLAKIYIAENKPDTAERLLLKSIAINIRPGYENSDAILAQMQLAELYFKLNKLQPALNLLDQIKDGLTSRPNNAVAVRWQFLMYKYSTAIKQYEAAQKYLEGYLALKDTADAADKKLKQTDFSQLLKNQETQYQVRLLTKDNQLNRLYLGITIGLSVIAVAIIFTVYHNYSRSRKNVQTLTLLNRQISEQKDQLEDTMMELRRSNQDKDRILQIVAHDLRNPVSGITALGTIIYDENKDDSYREELGMIIAASQSALALINDLLQFSGTMSTIQGQKEMVDLNELVKQVVGLLKFKANEKQQQIITELPAEPILIPAYKEKINRLLGNLITNAIKFSPERSAIYVWVTKKSESVLIEVRDSGIGIPEKLQAVIFDSFTPAKRYGTAGESSFGLGLSICRHIVEGHKGKIWVESAEGAGSSFFIELPLTEQ
jgi:signal transduction histidine kinase